MDEFLYVMTLEKEKIYNRMTKAVVTRHVDFIKKLDDDGLLAFCGITKGYKGAAGMIVFRAKDFEQAKEICKEEPLSAEGFTTYKLCSLQLANRENNYLA